MGVKPRVNRMTVDSNLRHFPETPRSLPMMPMADSIRGTDASACSPQRDLVRRQCYPALSLSVNRLKRNEVQLAA